ncbi:TLD-domain-containing protein [Pilatotrama ljubarskyi]|nr:TLD-domain-containing protein [Pilatotrama ljubarskyi]
MDGSSAQTPIPIPPLIPLPSQPPATSRDDREDVFATLFTPPTPRASPTRTPPPTQGRPVRHARTESTDSEFGAFVSVPATEDPLQLGFDERQPAFSQHNQDFFDKFTEEAKVASDRKRREVLDELLQHEDDPLYWLQGASSAHASGLSTPQPAQATAETSPASDSLIDLDSPSEARTPEVFVPPILPHASTATPTSSSCSSTSRRDIPKDTLLDLDWPSEAQSQKPLVPPVLPHPHKSTSPSTSTASSTSYQIALKDTLVDLDTTRPPESEREPRPPAPHVQGQHPATAPHIRSPSLPPSSPTRLSNPEIQRTQSYFSAPSFPSRIVSSLLSSAIRPSTTRGAPSASTAPSVSHTDDPSASRLPPIVAAATSHLAGFSRSAPHSRAATVSEGVPAHAPSTALDTAITHGTPFSSHIFVPPSGAPGFTGDRQWDKGFEYDKTQVERKSVRLTGRKEMTVPVLTVEIADMLRPFFPALARLPRAWTLLYSLDQHGISLNTLYARCQDFKGSELLIVRDSNNAVFGAWMGEGIHPSKGAYYGTGESFLWQLVGKDRVRVFKWTGKNDYVALCEPDYISFGGGDGHYGLWLDETLSDGSSARCPTFDNEPLCSPGPRQGETVTFECVGLEVWGIG